MVKESIFFLLFFFCAQVCTFADTVFLKSGQKVNGRVLINADDRVDIDVYGVRITYYPEEIDRVELSLDNGEKPVVIDEPLLKQLILANQDAYFEACGDVFSYEPALQSCLCAHAEEFMKLEQTLRSAVNGLIQKRPDLEGTMVQIQGAGFLPVSKTDVLVDDLEAYRKVAGCPAGLQ